MTSIFFVRHAQPLSGEVWPDDRTKPLTALGLEHRGKVASVLSEIKIDAFYSSPYKRSVDTISECAKAFEMDIHTDERFRERKAGENAHAAGTLEKRWADFNYCEKDGESLNSVQQRNIEALKDILGLFADKNIVIGTHGTALSTILNYYDSSFNCDGFKRIWHSMPYIIRLDFDNQKYIGREELLNVESFY